MPPRTLIESERKHQLQRAGALAAVTAASAAQWPRMGRRWVDLARWYDLESVAARVEADAYDAILAAREAGGVAGLRRLAVEVPTLRIGHVPRLTASWYAHPARLTAHRYAARWYDAAEAADLTAPEAAATANQAVSARAKTIAITESSNAFSLERRREMARVAADSRIEILERWDAMLDHLTCDACQSADGETILLGDSFVEGLPGAVHPRCRCTSHYIYASPAVSRRLLE